MKATIEELSAEYLAPRAALEAARDVLEELAKDTQSNAIAMQNKAVTGYMRARDSLVRVIKS